MARSDVGETVGVKRRVAGGGRAQPGQIVAAAALALIGATAAAAADGARPPAPQDKSRYTLADPTPDRLLRDLTTDRPDMTESPFTVDAGHVQVETNLFGYIRSRPEADGTITSADEFATANIRIGLTHDSEINVVLQPYGTVRTRPLAPLAATRRSGVGSVDLRAKINVWGNDTFNAAGSTALALLPFVTIPTDRGNGLGAAYVEAGLIVPFAVRLSDRLGLGLNGGVHALKRGPASGYHVEWLGSASLSYEWTPRFGSYVEVAARLNTGDPRGDAVLIGAGLTYKVHRNLQLDAGINFGATPAADRINPFVGLSVRF